MGNGSWISQKNWRKKKRFKISSSQILDASQFEVFWQKKMIRAEKTGEHDYFLPQIWALFFAAAFQDGKFGLHGSLRNCYHTSFSRRCKKRLPQFFLLMFYETSHESTKPTLRSSNCESSISFESFCSFFLSGNSTQIRTRGKRKMTFGALFAPSFRIDLDEWFH